VKYVSELGLDTCIVAVLNPITFTQEIKSWLCVV